MNLINLHFFAGAAISIIFGLLLENTFTGMGALFGLLFGVLSGVAKEVLYEDLIKDGKMSIYNFLTVCFGSFIGYIVLYLIFRNCG